MLFQGGVCRFFRYESDFVGRGIISCHAIWHSGGHPGSVVLYLSAPHLYRSLLWFQEKRKHSLLSDCFLKLNFVCCKIIQNPIRNPLI